MQGLHRAPILIDAIGGSDSNNNGKSNDKLPLEVGEEVKDPRRLSENERVLAGKLIAKHGDDYDAMAKDRRLNTYQHTHGKLKRLCDKHKSEQQQQQQQQQ